MSIVDSCITLFHLDVIMQLKISYHTATNVCSRKGATNFGDLPDWRIYCSRCNMVSTWVEGFDVSRLYAVHIQCKYCTAINNHDRRIGHHHPRAPRRKLIQCIHYSDVIMDAMASQITSLSIVYSTVYSGTDQRKHQSSASLAFVGNSPVTGESPPSPENVSIWWRRHALTMCTRFDLLCFVVVISCFCLLCFF